ncbi:MAG: ABC transporter permease [Oscillospiraceae bacterium]|nr:ABC transporter permease [Oscillospiraceae bacterium]
MLFKLSFNNMRRSLRDYAVYFFTLIIGVSIFYVFNATSGQAAMMQVSASTRAIIDLLKTLISGTSVLVSGILGFLIVYASSFLMKRRSREFALYMTLGMSKWKISSIILMETLFAGIGSLGCGLLIGIGLSQLMSALVANLFEADMTGYRFTVSGESVAKTIIYFAVMYGVVVLFNGGAITKMKLIDLMNSGKRSEQVKLKNPVLCVLIFLVSAAALGYCYFKVGFRTFTLSQSDILIYIIIGSIATFLIFWSVSGMLLRVVMSSKNLYHRGLNAFTFRQISSKVNTMVFSLTIICLMLFVTICSLTAAFSLRNSMNYNLNHYCPTDFEAFVTYSDDAAEKRSVADVYADYGVNMDDYFEKTFTFSSYESPELTFESFFGEDCADIREIFPYIETDSGLELIRLSDYNKLMEFYGLEDRAELNDGEYIVLCDLKSMIEFCNKELQKDTEINVSGHTLRAKYRECQDGFIDMSAQRGNMGIFIVPDDTVDENNAAGERFFGKYTAEVSDDLDATEEFFMEKGIEMTDGITEDSGIAYSMYFTRTILASASVGLGALATFLGLYIGLVFLIACGAILALKELSESVDSIGRYEMLRKIGAEENDISRSLFVQTGIFFLLPLLLSALHSVFGIKFAVGVLESFGTENIMPSVIATSAIILAIYGGYFVITYFCSRGIIKDRK